MKSNETTLTVQLVVKTQEVYRSLTNIVREIEGFSLLENKDAARVDILVMEIGNDPSAEFETIRLLLKENVVGTLFVTASQATSEILLPAMRAGAREFFQQPIEAEEVREAFGAVLLRRLEELNPDDEHVHKGRVFGVLGAKGGVGTTTFAVNFATSLQTVDPERLVALIDVNCFNGEVPLFLDIESDTSWEEIGRNLSRLDAAYLQSAMVRHRSGVYVLPAPKMLDIDLKLPKGFLYKLIRTMRQFFDDIVVDCGMRLTGDVVKICGEAESVYLISTMSMPCVINAHRVQQSLASSAGITNGRMQVIANRFEKKSQLTLGEASRVLGRDVINTIPNDYSLTMSALSSGRTVAEVAKRSSVAKAYRNLAESVCEAPGRKRRGIFGLFG